MLKLMPPHRYRLVVEGELGPRYASAFDGMTIYAHDGETEITGAIIDQSHLQGLLTRVATSDSRCSASPHSKPERAG